MADTKKFESTYTEINLIWHNNLLLKDETCTDYKSLNYTYEECATEQFEKLLMKELGCLPPWFTTSKVYYYSICLLLIINNEKIQVYHCICNPLTIVNKRLFRYPECAPTLR